MTAPVAPTRRAARQAEEERPFAGVMLGLVIALSIALVVIYLRDSGGSDTGAPPKPATDSAEATFARDMQNHHGQAVEMAVIVRERSTDRQLQEFAADMALGQQQEIGQMRAWLAFWGLPPVAAPPAADPHAGMGSAQGMPTSGDVAELKTLSGKALDLRFLDLMIGHHQGGVAMADAVLARTDNAVVRDLAMTIKQVQLSEIALMQEFIRLRGGKPST